MLVQYRQIKSELPPDALLLFRLGDFYEMFFEDAKEASDLLNLTLTKRGENPMCGVPYHAAKSYLSKLLRAGKKIAICDQMETPKPGQLVKRAITQILSPGTHFDEQVLSAERNNFLASVFEFERAWSVAFTDLTTGDFFVTELSCLAELQTEIERQSPSEIIYPSELEALRTFLTPLCHNIVPYDDWTFALETAFFTLKDHFKVASLEGFGLKNEQIAVSAAGAVIHYLKNVLRRDLRQISKLVYYEHTAYLALDKNSLRSLEVLESLNKEAPSSHSLFGVLNKTITPMGARKLRGWLSQPLSNQKDIIRRQNAVQMWLEQHSLREKFRQSLKIVKDLERVLSRLNTTSANARDLIALKQALEQLPDLKQTLRTLINSSPKFPNSLIEELLQDIQELPEIVQLIDSKIVEDPPLSVREGNLIRTGANAELDELREISTGGKNWLAKLQQSEISRTGIQTLKIRYNTVFGYYIEVSKGQLDKVPANYTRKQTLTNAERFITPELKEWENKILGAQERLQQIEYELFQEVRATVLEKIPSIQKTAQNIATLDILATFAEIAFQHNYVRPTIGNENILWIKDGRHPVLEQSLLQGNEINLISRDFVPNDIDLNCTDKQIALITGPNMAGKSTYIRQTALLTLLAHTGSYIPASEARIDIVDRIFTRIGASDDLARGQSTFMVEMSETASILNNATANSLIVLDEIGRGTSTFDGLSLAWSIVEYLHNQCGAKTLFATHYHELTELANRLERVHNLNVGVRENKGEIVFLHKILSGAADKSYGIHVAKLAGIPPSILKRAEDVLKNLEESELTPLGENKSTEAKGNNRIRKLKNLPDPNQLDLFSQLGLN